MATYTHLKLQGNKASRQRNESCLYWTMLRKLPRHDSYHKEYWFYWDLFNHLSLTIIVYLLIRSSVLIESTIHLSFSLAAVINHVYLTRLALLYFMISLRAIWAKTECFKLYKKTFDMIFWLSHIFALYGISCGVGTSIFKIRAKKLWYEQSDF